MKRLQMRALVIVGVVVAALLTADGAGWFEVVATRVQSAFESVFRQPTGNWIQVPGLRQVYLLMMALSAAWLSVQLPFLSRRLGFLLGLSFLTLTLSPILAFNGVVFEPLSGILAVALAGTAAIGFAGTKQSERRHRLKRYFVGRLSEANFEHLIAEKSAKGLTGRTEVTALTCRLMNHSELSREMEPDALERVSSSFLEVVAEFLVSKGGYLDECDVHRVRVLFGYPLADSEHALHAVKVSLELRQRLVNLTREVEDKWHQKLLLGASVVTGEVVGGLFGYQQFAFFSVVGEVLEFGDRLCGANAVYGSHLLISSATFAKVESQVEVRSIEMMWAHRLAPIHEAFELLGLKGTLSEEQERSRDAFWQGIVLLRKSEFAEARKCFENAKIEGRDDPPLQFFLKRSDDALNSATANSIGTSKVRSSKKSKPKKA